MNRSSILAVASGIRKAQLNSLTRVQKQLCYQQCYASTSSTTVNIPEIKELNKTKVLYDGECRFCKVEIAGLKWLAEKKPNVEFVDISSAEYEPAFHSGVTYEQAMQEMHVFGPLGQVYTQGDAMREMYRASGLGWLARLTGLPVIKEVSDWMYLRFVPYRLRKAFARCESESDRCSTKLHQLRDKLKDSL